MRTLVIGGGAAGIAAARALHDAGQEVLLVEAKDRLGGRAHSVTLGDFKLDAGCGWLHSAKRNPWTTLAERYGLTVDRSDPGWGRQWRDLGFPPEQHEAFGRAWDTMESAARAALTGPDRALGAFIARNDPWRPLLDAISGYINGARLDAVSIRDWAAYDDAATEDNWAVREGYGTLVTRHAAGVPVRTGARVSRIDHRGRTIRAATSAGTIEADRVIVAVPTTALASGALTFDPPLAPKRDAAAALPLGLADKLFLAVDGPEFPANAHLLGNPRSACTGSYRLAPFGWPVVEVFLGGDCAEALEGEDDRAAYDFACGELTSLLGSDWRFTPLGRTRWRHDPEIGGSYSHARVGMADQRQVLAEPVDERLFFAGEACHPSDFSTAHGAYATGLAAAEAVMASRD